MPAAFDASAYSDTLTATTTTLGLVTSGNDRCLVVAIVVYDALSVDVLSVTYNGVALTLAGSQVSPAGNFKVYLYYLVNPALGNNNVVVTYSTTVNEGHVTALNFTGVNQVTPVGTFVSANGSSAAPSVTVTSELGGMVVDAMSIAASGVAATVGSGQTDQWHQSGIYINSYGSTEAGAASVVMNWSLTGSVNWVEAALPLKSGTGAGNMMMRGGN